MRNSCHLFLGANSGEGFFSLYDQLLQGHFDDLLILKGGPGCGKSSFMRRVADCVKEKNFTVDFIHCSGDPDSLDGVIFPELRAGIVDGTAPHAMEPQYAVAVERYVDLTRFYDVAAMKSRRDEVVPLYDGYRAAYRAAYHILRAAGALAAERRGILKAKLDREHLLKRAAGIIRRELRGKGTRQGNAAYAFLGGMTHLGGICRYDTVEAICPRIYELADPYGLGGEMLELFAAAARNAGLDALICRDPDCPHGIQHILIPERGLAFVTSNDRWQYGGKPYRRIHPGASAERELSRAERARLRITRRVCASLEEEAVLALKRAKETHDALEALCNPCVDFKGVYALAEGEAEAILKRA